MGGKGEEKESNEMMHASYVFYVLPVNIEASNIDEGYDFFTEISEINDYYYTVAKLVPLNPFNVDLDLDLAVPEDIICCETSFRDIGDNNVNPWKNYYGWEFPEDCVTSFESGSTLEKRITIVEDSICKDKTYEKKRSLVSEMLNSDIREIFKKNILNNDVGNSIKKPVLISVFNKGVIEKWYGGPAAITQHPWEERIPFTYISNRADKETLAHELGHRVGGACDEYREPTWSGQSFRLKKLFAKIKNKITQGGRYEMLSDGCPNPEREEDGKPFFPSCCKLKRVCPYGVGECLKETASFSLTGRKILKDEKDEDYACMSDDLKVCRSKKSP